MDNGLEMSRDLDSVIVANGGAHGSSAGTSPLTAVETRPDTSPDTHAQTSLGKGTVDTVKPKIEEEAKPKLPLPALAAIVGVAKKNKEDEMAKANESVKKKSVLNRIFPCMNKQPNSTDPGKWNMYACISSCTYILFFGRDGRKTRGGHLVPNRKTMVVRKCFTNIGQVSLCTSK
jgi:hypothetical protein